MSLSRLPPAPLRPGDPPCHECTALCCRYYALQIDTPEDAEDFDAIRWYVMHESSWVWVDDGDWYLQVDRVCTNLGPGGECRIYDERPQICRDYGLPDRDAGADEVPCDYFADGSPHDLELRTPEEVQHYAREHLARRESDRRRRSEAARRGWQRRRARANPTP